ncbi:phosphate-selective porin O/P [Bacteroides zoogleoformans]|uniref:Phosphate-selective porin O/P n=1 Tax=Bacteroides zoogleoformans TaxID=28119 RepID=A0ABM6TAM0_9BACE|nr:hypothetical protein [Bacteroides zoogleoformans]AVM53718.1 hypothetical protein C4H11_13105 [Bacteroides zoogleoformans]TWJ18128.1 phosphate-selective porin O/P [Bacteroides zoogleoformans]
MKKRVGLFALCFSLSVNALQAGEPDEKKEVPTEVNTETPTPKEQKKELAAEDEDYRSFRFGGYGEMVASFKDYGINRFGGPAGNSKENRNTIAIPRFVLALDYKFSPKWILGAEIEFEAGGVGTEMELENAENGEYETEMEKGGEVALEQFHVTRLIHRSFNLRAGHMIVPVGLTNAHHEPINFFGTYRPEGETTIIPSTWHETGLAAFGTVGRGYATFDYQAMVVTGLNADGFGRDYWVKGGKQGLFEVDNFTSPAYVARLDYRGIRGLRVGASFYYCNDVTANADKRYKYSSVGRSAVTIYSVDAQYKNKYVTARANLISGTVENSNAIGNVSLPNASGYYHGAMRNLAKEAICYGVEAGVNLSALLSSKHCPVIYPYARYEYFNPQEKGEGSYTVDKRCQVSKWSVGLNWFALPNLVVKADYAARRIGTDKVFKKGKYTGENEFSIGVAYVGWFIKK